jgi:hypothetical protein
VGVAVALGATALNWWRLARRPEQACRGAVVLELAWFRWWTAARLATAGAAVAALAVAGPLGAAAASLAIVASEAVGRWLFFVTVVPLNMPGAFWRSAAGSHR